MKFSLAACTSLLGVALSAPTNVDARAGSVQGFDISNWQPNVDFTGAYNSGARFVMIKASEGTTYKDPSFNKHYTGATAAGLYRGGYHFALPDSSSGAAQAKHFLAMGGGWTGDGITLPGMLDIETNPYGAKCYGKSASSMVAWIQDFVNTYKAETGREPMIYSSPSWWTTCTGNSSAFSKTCPLVLARWASSPGAIPGGWPWETFWQNNDSYRFGGDSEIFNGDQSQLDKFTKG